MIGRCPLNSLSARQQLALATDADTVKFYGLKILRRIIGLVSGHGGRRGLGLVSCRWLLAVCLAGFATHPSAFALTIGNLRCENLEQPLGIDVLQPRLSWILKSTEGDQVQTAYQILVATSVSKLKHGVGDLWDSGRISSDQSIQISYAGKSLHSQEQCFWKVRVWDKNGKASPWSEIGRWTMGLLEPDDWKAKWIGLDGEEKTNWLSGTDWIWFPEGEPQIAAPISDRYFRRAFGLPTDREIKRARLLITGDRECHAYVNGHDMGGQNNYHNAKDIDVTFLLHTNSNVIALLGRNSGKEPNPAGVVARLEVEFDRGEPLIIPTDEQWKTSDHEVIGWTKLEFDDTSWRPAKKIGPVGMDPWGGIRSPESRRLSARWLRKEFAVSGKVKQATVYFSGLGLSELYLNGKKVGNSVLSPALAEYPKRVYYITSEVTKQLRPGANCLGVVLGNGRFYSPRSLVFANMPSYGFPKLLLHLRIEYANGAVAEIVSDESWKLTANGPILANNEYDGEDYDARKEFDDWSKAGFNDNAWQKAELVSPPAGALASQMIEPIRVTQTIRPVSITEPKPGVFVFDMGQNMVGWCRLKVVGPARTTVSLRHAESL